MKLPQRAQVPADGLSGCSAQRAISRSVPSIEAAILPERERSGLRRGERSGLRPRLPLRRPPSTEGCRGETPRTPRGRERGAAESFVPLLPLASPFIAPRRARSASGWGPRTSCGRCGSHVRIGGPPTPAPLPPGAAEGAPRTERFGWRNREKATASSRFERVDDGWRYLDGFLW